MSDYNLKIKRWERDGDVRYYLDGRFVDHRSEWSNADGVYLCADENGGIKWKHGFRTGPHTVARAERNAKAAKAIISGLDLDGISFAEFERRYAECLTVRGNFSVRQYEKKFQLAEA